MHTHVFRGCVGIVEGLGLWVLSPSVPFKLGPLNPKPSGSREGEPQRARDHGEELEPSCAGAQPKLQ